MFTIGELILRGLQDRDVGDILALYNDYRIQRYLTTEPTVPRPEKYKEYLKTQAENAAIWFSIGQRDTTRFIGYCSVRVPQPKNRDGVFTVLIHPDWANGLEEVSKFTVGYAFRALGLQRISLMVLEGDVRAIETFIKIGFQEEGRKRRANWAEGHWEDAISMGVLAEEWAQKYQDESLLPYV